MIYLVCWDCNLVLFYEGTKAQLIFIFNNFPSQSKELYCSNFVLTYSLAANGGEFAIYSRRSRTSLSTKRRSCRKRERVVRRGNSVLWFPSRKCSDDYVYHGQRGDRNSHVLQLSFSRETRLGHRRWTHVERVGVWRNARRPDSPRAEFSNDCFRASSLHWFRMLLATARLLVKQIRITSSIILAVLVVTCIQHLRQ